MKEANYAPLYCSMYPKLAEIARSHGYAMAVHGSMASDFDLICIPWVDKPGTPFDVIESILDKFALKLIGDGPTMRLHNRQVWTLSISGKSYLDLSFMLIEKPNT